LSQNYEFLNQTGTGEQLGSDVFGQLGLGIVYSVKPRCFDV